MIMYNSGEGSGEGAAPPPQQFLNFKLKFKKTKCTRQIVNLSEQYLTIHCICCEQNCKCAIIIVQKVRKKYNFMKITRQRS